MREAVEKIAAGFNGDVKAFVVMAAGTKVDNDDVSAALACGGNSNELIGLLNAGAARLNTQIIHDITENMINECK